MYQIVSDGSCDLNETLVKEYGFHVVPFYITTDGITHQKEKVDIEVEELYQFMVNHQDVFPKTSMPAVEDYVNVFQPILEKGDDIICICITTKFSGSYNSALSAKQIIEDDYPHSQITIIDATVNTVLQGLLVIEACHMRDNGFSYSEAVQRINEIKQTGRIFFTVGNFEYLIHGGRIGKVAGVAAKTLGIKPLIVLQDGEIFASGITRGRAKSKRQVIANALKYFQQNHFDPAKYSWCVGHGYDKQEGYEFKEQLEKALKEAYADFCEPILVQHIGATIGVHTGPYPIGLGLIEKYK